MVFYDDTHELTLHIQFTCIKCNNENGNIRKKNGLYNYGPKMLKQQRIKPHHISAAMHDYAETISQARTGQLKNDTHFLGTV